MSGFIEGEDCNITITYFRKNNGEAIGPVGREGVMLCRRLNLFTKVYVAIGA